MENRRIGWFEKFGVQYKRMKRSRDVGKKAEVEG